MLKENHLKDALIFPCWRRDLETRRAGEHMPVPPCYAIIFPGGAIKSSTAKSSLPTQQAQEGVLCCVSTKCKSSAVTPTVRTYSQPPLPRRNRSPGLSWLNKIKGMQGKKPKAVEPLVDS